MSFGWSVGDIVAALQLLDKVVVALKDTGGASSHYQDVSAFLGVLTVTLQHLKALQAAPLDPDIAKNLEQLCAQIQGPLTSFRERIHLTFDRDLGSDSTRPKFLTAGRKLKWAISTSKEVKDLEKKIGRNISVIGVVLSQQVIQTTLQMPSEIQARIAHTIDRAIDTRINPHTLAVHKEVAALSAAEKASSKLIKGTIQDVVRQNAAEMQKYTQITSAHLEEKFNALSLSQRTCAASTFRIEDRSRMILEAVYTQTSESRADSKTVQAMAVDLFANQSRTTDAIVRAVQQEGQKNTSVSKKRILNLHKKLDHMSSLMGTVNNHMSSLSIARQSARLSTTNSEIETAIGSLRQSLWLLLSALHVLIRELIYLIAPYLITLYHIRIQPLLVSGDQFLFEDAIGRRKWLPCLQFQHWENFYNLLVDIFQGEVGLSRILNGQFVVLNGFNEAPIYKKAWRAGIQPKSRVIMAIMVESTAINKGRCANPSCPGQINFGKDEVTRVCPICGKHLYTLKDVSGHDEDFGSEAQIYGFNPMLNEKDGPPAQVKWQVDTKTKKNMHLRTDRDVAAYKRVICQDSDGDKISVTAVEQVEEPMSRSPYRRSSHYLWSKSVTKAKGKKRELFSHKAPQPAYQPLGFLAPLPGLTIDAPTPLSAFESSSNYSGSRYPAPQAIPYDTGENMFASTESMEEMLRGGNLLDGNNAQAVPPLHRADEFEVFQFLNIEDIYDEDLT